MGASMYVRLALGGILYCLASVAAAENAVTNDTATVRAGPDDSYPEVAQLDAGSPVQVMGCLDDWSWCDVGFGEYRGWLYSPDITYEYRGGYVPFYSYAPAFGVPVVTFSLDDYWGRHYHDRPWYGERDEWLHRQIHHRLPPGPAPSHSPPPRDFVHTDRPHGGGGNPIRLGSAAPTHPDGDHHGSAAPPAHSDMHRAPPDVHSQGHAAPPPAHAVSQHAPPRHEEQRETQSHQQPGKKEEEHPR